MKDKKNPPPRLHFAAIPLAAAANRRMGKHYRMVSQTPSDLEKLDQYSALKVEFLKVGVKKADLRAALHRAAQKKNVPPAPMISTFTCFASKPETRPEWDAGSGRLKRTGRECPFEAANLPTP